MSPIWQVIDNATWQFWFVWAVALVVVVALVLGWPDDWL